MERREGEGDERGEGDDGNAKERNKGENQADDGE